MFTPSPGVKREAPFSLLVLLALWALFVGNPGNALAQDDDCAKLADLELPADTAITDVELVTSGEFNPPPDTFPPGPITGLPVFCRVHVLVDRAINIEVWMPAGEAWNGRFQTVGGGVYAGVISFGAMGGALRDGYATASTDTGHNFCSV